MRWAALILAIACAPPQAGLPDAATPDAAAADAEVSDASLDAGSATLGETYRDGELIARYDRSLWAALPADEIVYAFFDPARFADYPDDRSLIFTAEPSFDPAPAGEPYRDFLRRQRITIDRVPLMERAFVITAGERYHLTENGYGDFAWDLVLTDAAGVRFNGMGLANEDYLIWDRPVVLPNGGYVVEVVRDSPDNAPGTAPDDPHENLIGVHLGGSYYLYLLHFRQGSIPGEVDVGAILEPGAIVGAVGNSGLSLEPHLHVSLLWYDGARSWSVPSEFAGIATATSATAPATPHDFIAPPSGVWIE